MDLINSFYASLDTAIISQVLSWSTNFTKGITPLMMSALGLYIVFVVYRVTFHEESSVSEFLKTGLSIALISAVLIGTPMYNTYIIPLALNLGETLTNLLAQDNSNVQEKLMGVLTSADEAWASMNDEVSGISVWDLDIGLLITTMISFGIIYTGALVFTLYGFAYLIITKIITAILLIIGPMFICFSFFPSTRTFFNSWLGSLLSFGTQISFYTILFSILSTFIKNNFVGSEDGIELAKSVGFFFITIISVMVMHQLSGQMSGLFNSAGVSSLSGGLSALGRNTGVTGAAKGIGGGAGKGAGFVAKGGAGLAFKGAVKGGGALLNKARGTGNIKAG